MWKIHIAGSESAIQNGAHHRPRISCNYGTRGEDGMTMKKYYRGCENPAEESLMGNVVYTKQKFFMRLELGQSSRGVDQSNLERTEELRGQYGMLHHH